MLRAYHTTLPNGTEYRQKIGVMAPFNGQINLLTNLLKDYAFEIDPELEKLVNAGFSKKELLIEKCRFLEQLEILTINKAQGRQKEVMIIDTTIDFSKHYAIDDPRKINVALTRPEEKRVIITSFNNFPPQQGCWIPRLCKHHIDNNEVIKTKKTVDVEQIVWLDRINMGDIETLTKESPKTNNKQLKLQIKEAFKVNESDFIEDKNLKKIREEIEKKIEAYIKGRYFKLDSRETEEFLKGLREDVSSLDKEIKKTKLEEGGLRKNKEKEAFIEKLPKKSEVRDVSQIPDEAFDKLSVDEIDEIFPQFKRIILEREKKRRNSERAKRKRW